MTLEYRVTINRAERLLNVLDLKQIEENLYLGENEPDHGPRIFGGQVLAQASMAAYRTVADLDAHSIHAYFLRPGDSSKQVLFEVERIRDGRSFSTRRVVAIQSGQAIFNMDISFQAAEIGLEHSLPMPNVPLPSELQEDRKAAQRLGGAKADLRLSAMAKLQRPFELRSVFELGTPAWAEARAWNPVWVRFMAPVTEAAGPSQPISRCLLAYASDMGVVSTGYLPHQNEVDRSQLQMASLDHSLWIHRPVPMDQWLLFHKRTSSAHGARALVHADFFSSDGQLIASVTQEGLLRAKE